MYSCLNRRERKDTDAAYSRLSTAQEMFFHQEIKIQKRFIQYSVPPTNVFSSRNQDTETVYSRLSTTQDMFFSSRNQDTETVYSRLSTAQDSLQ